MVFGRTPSCWFHDAVIEHPVGCVAGLWRSAEHRLRDPGRFTVGVMVDSVDGRVKLNGSRGHILEVKFSFPVSKEVLNLTSVI